MCVREDERDEQAGTALFTFVSTYKVRIHTVKKDLVNPDLLSSSAPEKLCAVSLLGLSAEQKHRLICCYHVFPLNTLTLNAGVLLKAPSSSWCTV